MQYLFSLTVATLCMLAGIHAVSYIQILFDPHPGANYTLPPLPYGTEELEPHIDNETVNVHHYGHQLTYTSKLNSVLTSWRSKDKSGLSSKSLVEIFANIKSVPVAYRQDLINNGGGYVNHLLYWYCMSPNSKNASRVPSGSLAAEINARFGNYENFVSQFNAAAAALFGSGYVWLVRNKSGHFKIYSTSNQDLIFQQSVCPGPSNGICAPSLTLDVWEHAYYLKNKNMRANYVAAWWRLVDWNRVAELDAAFRNVSVLHHHQTRDIDGVRRRLRALNFL